MPKVSIILPTYNRSRLLIEAVQSVLDQNYSDFELIVIDDGSSDNTAAKVLEFRDRRVKYFYKNNGGVSSARNLGLSKAYGEYIAFLDSDDLWPKEYLEVMVAALEKNPDYGLAYSLFKDYFADGKIKDGFKKERFISGYFALEYYKRTPCLLPSAVIIRKETLNGMRFDENLETTEDQDLFIRLSARTDFLFVGEVCVERRITEGSLSDKKFNYNSIRVFERFYYHLGGDKIIPKKIAMTKFSEHYRGLARSHYNEKHRKAAVELFKKAVKFHPSCLKNYRWLLKALLLNSKNDTLPGWKMPDPLPPCITVEEENIQEIIYEKS